MGSHFTGGVATLAAYANSLQGKFVFDDKQNIERKLTVLTIPNAWDLLWNDTRPLLTYSLAINYAWGGTSVTGYHVINIAVHILAALFLFGFAAYDGIAQ